MSKWQEEFQSNRIRFPAEVERKISTPQKYLLSSSCCPRQWQLHTFWPEPKRMEDKKRDKGKVEQKLVSKSYTHYVRWPPEDAFPDSVAHTNSLQCKSKPSLAQDRKIIFVYSKEGLRTQQFPSRSKPMLKCIHMHKQLLNVNEWTRNCRQRRNHWPLPQTTEPNTGGKPCLVKPELGSRMFRTQNSQERLL